MKKGRRIRRSFREIRDYPFPDREEAAVTEPDFDLDARINLIRNSPKKSLFETLYDKGDISKYKSASEADFALISILVPWLEGSPSMLDRAYRQSALYKNGRDEKWDRCGEQTSLTDSLFTRKTVQPSFPEVLSNHSN